jgi:ABC-2 type transport system ATP-binding protein
MDTKLVVRVDHVSKDFVLPHEKVSTLKGVFTSLAKGKSWKEKETQHALRDVSLEVKRGEFFGIVGRNGSGKSTLLKMLAGIYQPTKGSISVHGKLVPFIELGVGFNPELTGRENVYLNGAMMGFSEKKVDTMYEDIVEFAELEQFMDQKLKNYSTGMQVRLAFSVAIKAEAEILLVDEVLAVGDADFQRKCYQYFKSLKRDKTTVIFVSHDMSAIRDYCDRVALIEDSRLQAVGLPVKISELYEQLFVHDLPKRTGTNSARWGTGDIKLKKVELSKTTLQRKDKFVQLEITVEGVKSNKTFMTGFRVINDAGQCIQETNTWNEDKKMPLIGPGDEYTICWNLPNIYSDGEYTIDVYVHDYYGAVAESWSEAVSFQSINPKFRGVLVVPPVEVELVK